MIRLNPALAVPLLAVPLLGAAGCSGAETAIKEPPTWHNDGVNAVSRTIVGAGVAATTSLRKDDTLETVTLDLTSGKKLWAQPATMIGRLPGMGVQAPAIVEAGGQGVVASVEPVRGGKTKAALVARDARTGRQKWSRPVRSTFGPQRCGRYLCVSEDTALTRAQVVVLDPATGRSLWTLPGVAEVEWSDAETVVMLRLAAHSVLEAHELKTGRTVWQTPVDQALGSNVELSGGWAFGVSGDNLIGYVAPYTDQKTRIPSAFGMFSMRLSDGVINWMRPSVVRVYPSGSPGFAPVVRPVDKQGQYGGFALLDAGSGRVIGQISAGQVPGTGWWLAFPQKLNTLGFLKHDGGGAAFDLTTGKAAQAKGRHGWSFCVTNPRPLRLANITPLGFYPVASLCEFDLGTGKRIGEPGTPPVWFTGSQDGWRLWRDEKGSLHAVKDGTATTPSMYGGV